MEATHQRVEQMALPTISDGSGSNVNTHRSGHTGADGSGSNMHTASQVHTDVHTEDEFQYPDDSSSESSEDQWQASKVRCRTRDHKRAAFAAHLDAVVRR